MTERSKGFFREAELRHWAMLCEQLIDPPNSGIEYRLYDTSIKIRAEDLISDFPPMRAKPTPERFYVLRNGDWIRWEDDFGFGIFEPHEDPELNQKPDWSAFARSNLGVP